MHELTAQNRISDAAYDALMAIYKRHRDVFHAAHGVGGLKALCRKHRIAVAQ